MYPIVQVSRQTQFSPAAHPDCPGTVIEEIAFHELDGILNLALTFRIRTPAEVYFHPAVLTELLKFVGVDDIAAVLADTDDAVLVEYHLSRHTSPVAETVMAGRDRSTAVKGLLWHWAYLYLEWESRNAATYTVLSA